MIDEVGEVARVLGVLADVQPERSSSALDALRADTPIIWRGYDTSMRPMDLASTVPTEPRPLSFTDRTVRRLAAIDALHEHERLLRSGWVWIVGRTQVDGRDRKVCVPVITRSVTLQRGFTSSGVIHRGDLEMSVLIDDASVRARLLDDVQWGGGALYEGGGVTAELIQRLPRLTGWIRDSSAAMGLPVREVRAGTDVRRLRDEMTHGLVAVVGTAIYVARDIGSPTQAASLRSWAARPGIDDTAFARLFDMAPVSRSADDDLAQTPAEVVSPLLLTRSQTEVVRRSRTEPLVTVSGAPGNGKSHAVAAIALDAVSRGQSVLVATPSPYAADVIADLLARQPGPDPVVFGSSEARQAIADNLSAGSTHATSVREAMERHHAAAAERDALEDVVLDALATEQAAASRQQSALLPQIGRRLPGLADADVDIDAIDRLAHEAGIIGAGLEGLFAGFRRGRRRAELARLLGTTVIDEGFLTLALRAVRARRAAATLEVHGGTQLEGLWDELLRLDDNARTAVGDLLGAEVAHRRVAGRGPRRAVASLATALRAGRTRRRELLAGIDADDLTRALPLWVGDLQDIGDLLPERAAMFDLVILDEASQLDLARSAPALLRGRRGVVVGDPRQLRHVSFISDDDMLVALEDHDLEGLAGVIDVRRVSAFDAAAGTAGVTFLREHFRSAPHLIGFSLERFYERNVDLMTRHPAVDTSDVIDVVRVESWSGEDKVVPSEVAAIGRLLDDLEAEGAASVGIVSPFRKQADAIESWVLDHVDLDRIERLGLRVGTVHAFQGSERDVMIISLGLCDDDPPGRRRFADDPHLCNVMVTRARDRAVVVTAMTDTPPGLIGAYLDWAEHPPAPPVIAPPPHDAFVRGVMEELRTLGRVVRPSYEVGPHAIDAVVGDDRGAVAVTMRVHPDGPEAHVARELDLRRLGWRMVDLWPTRFEGDPIEAALHLHSTRDA